MNKTVRFLFDRVIKKHPTFGFINNSNKNIHLKPCPNCGKLCHEYELNHSSTRSCHPSFSSTLYGVCKTCADVHKGNSI
jgi:hypothetical protein